MIYIYTVYYILYYISSEKKYLGVDYREIFSRILVRKWAFNRNGLLFNRFYIKWSPEWHIIILIEGIEKTFNKFKGESIIRLKKCSPSVVILWAGQWTYLKVPYTLVKPAKTGGWYSPYKKAAVQHQKGTLTNICVKLKTRSSLNPVFWSVKNRFHTYGCQLLLVN